MRTVTISTVLGILIGTLNASAADPSWHRSGQVTADRPAPFHSTQAIVLPTAETLDKGMLLFEISHRFLPHFSDGHEALWGLDGPANIRFGLGFGITDRLLITAGRSNLLDNYDLSLRYDLVHSSNMPLPLAAALQIGAAWNTEVPLRDAGNSRNYQYFAQVSVNAELFRRLSVGVVPTLLHNYAIFSDDAENGVTVGLYSRFQTTRIMALLVEWNIAERGYYYQYDAVSFGFELETGGHFFKMVASNSTTLNQSQYLPGTIESADPDNWHFGFLITRLLRL